MGLYLLVQQVDVELSTGDHGYPELGAELVVQLPQRAHEELPVRCNRLVARLCWRVRPQSCAKVMLGCCKACHTWSEAGHDFLRPFQALRQQNSMLQSWPISCHCLGSLLQSPSKPYTEGFEAVM